MDQTVSPKILSTDLQGAREAKARHALIAMLEDLSGESLEAVGPATTFLEMGFDSLFLGQVAQQLQSDFGVSITFRQLLSEFATLPALAAYLSDFLPPDPVQQAAPPASPVATEAARQPVPAVPNVGQAGQTQPLPIVLPSALQPGAGVEHIIRDQLQVMSNLMLQQLEVVRGLPVGSSPTTAAPMAVPVATAQAITEPGPVKPSAPPQPAPSDEASRFDAHKVSVQIAASKMTPEQRRHIDELIAGYTQRTAGSKRIHAEISRRAGRSAGRGRVPVSNGRRWSIRS